MEEGHHSANVCTKAKGVMVVVIVIENSFTKCVREGLWEGFEYKKEDK